MFALQLAIGGRDLKTMISVMSCCGSLTNPHGHQNMESPFRWLLAALDQGDMENALAAATEFVTDAIPEEGEPDPRRATVHTQGSAIMFTTPGGVEVEISPMNLPEAEWEWTFVVRFHRDSQQLAMQMLMAIVANSGVSFTVGVDESGIGEFPKMRAGRVLAQLLFRMDTERF